MKTFRTLLACACMAVSLCTSAQENAVPLNEPDYNKPKLFASLPEILTVNINSLTDALTMEVGNTVTLSLNSSFRFQGEIVSIARKYENRIQSVVIRSSNFAGATLTFTRAINEDGSINYSGRIMSMQHGDLYELQERSGQYSLVKKKFYDLINE